MILTGQLANTTPVAPPTVVLYTYQLTGRITDCERASPSQGAFVVTRTQDRNFWTFSQPSDANGDYPLLLHRLRPGREGSRCRSACR